MAAFAAPPAEAAIGLLVDWLELEALVSEDGYGSVDWLLSSIVEQAEEHEEDIGAFDAAKDRLVEAVENEIEERSTMCGTAYPFELSSDAEQLLLAEEWRTPELSIYLVCLLASHLSGSPILDRDLPDALIGRLRNRVFQIIATLAMAGYSGGSAGSIGWPRMPHESILEALRRTTRRGSGIRVKENPGPYTPEHEKDGGIDVMAWTVDDRPPPINFYYAQAASGSNWRGKSVREFVDPFEWNYLDDAPRGNKNYATLIPFRETDEIIWFHEHKKHGALFDRTRVASCGYQGIVLARQGREMDEAGNAPEVSAWVVEVRAVLLQDA